MRELLFIALVLACPLMMMFMMRDGHRHGGGHAGHGGHVHGSNTGDSTEDLRRRREELDRLIEERERADERELEPMGWGRR
jgi:hypothetical protein